MSDQKILEWIIFVLAPSQRLAEHLEKLTPEDEANLIEDLHHHLLAARAYRIFSEHNKLFYLSEEAQASLMSGQIYSISLHTQYERELKRLEDKLQIPFAKLKGIHLAHRHYPFPHDRSFSDLDLLFLSKDKEIVREKLISLGYREELGSTRFFANAHKMDFIHKDNTALRVEAHFGLGSSFPIQKREDELLEKFQHSEKNPELEYVFLLQHGLIQHRLQKAIWLLDLQLILSKHKIQNITISKEMATADFIARNWIEQIVGYEQSLIIDPLLKDILLVKIDQNHFKTARLRAKLMGGWPKLLRYAFARATH